MKIQLLSTLKKYKKDYLKQDIFSGIIITAVSTVAPCGTTVRMFIDSGITWEDAMPMMQNVTLK